MKKFLSGALILLVLAITQVRAHEYRNILQQKADVTAVGNALLTPAQWVPYPAYSNRTAWDALTAQHKATLIQRGEAALAYTWKVVPASAYLEFEKSGSRTIMEGPMGENMMAVTNLLVAELAEGKGRFIPALADGIWYFCDITSWVSSAHLGRQSYGGPLPNPFEQIIDLAGGDIASVFAWSLHFLQPALDKYNPLIAKRLRHEMQVRIFDPFMQREDQWWQAVNATPTTMVNNWNPWCNFNVLTSFLLLETDKQQLAKAVHRTMVSVDKFLNYVHDDGACEEGPSYWGHAAGKLYDYLQVLHYATGGKVSIFDHPMVKNMGEYIVHSYVGSGWVVNFADASARKGNGYAGLTYRYGKAVGSQTMMQYAAYLQQKEKGSALPNNKDVFRLFESMQYDKEITVQTAATSTAPYVWYPQTEFCYMRSTDGFFFAGKGGHNAESHNHNDLGNFVLFYNQVPFFLDAGVGTYTRQTFSSERYSIWTMQSEYHNVPHINGFAQPAGRQYKAVNTTFLPEKMRFSTNIAGAYPAEAAVKKWERSYVLQAGKGLVIEDNFELSEAKAANAVHFLTWAAPDVSKAGIVLLQKEGITLAMQYDGKQFDAVVDEVVLDDVRLSNVWGPKVYRLRLQAKNKTTKGKYSFQIKKI